LRDVVPGIRERGAEIAVVGNGSAEQAAGLVRELGLDFPLFTDPERRTFAALGARRSLGGVLNLGTLKSAVRAWSAGHRQHGVQGDAMQLGGTVVIHPGGRVAHVHRSEHAGQLPPLDGVLAAVEDRKKERDHADPAP